MARQNPRCPTEPLTALESERLRTLAQARGADEATRIVGLHRETFFKAATGLPIARLTAATIRGRLDRI